METIDRTVPYHVLKYIDSVETHDAQIVNAALAYLLQELDESLEEHLQPYVVELRTADGYFLRGVAHAEANLNHDRLAVAEQLLVIKDGILIENPVFLQIIPNRALIAFTEAPVPQHIAPDRTLFAFPELDEVKLSEEFLVVDGLPSLCRQNPTSGKLAHRRAIVHNTHTRRLSCSKM